MLQKIGIKLIFTVGITTILIIGVYAYFNIRSQSEVLLAEVERHAHQLSVTVKNSTRYDMLLNQRKHVHRIINTIGRGANINDVRVLNKEGEIIYSSNPNDIGLMVDKDAESCYACHSADEALQRLSIPERTRIYRIAPDSARTLGIINPIYNESSCWEADCHEHDEKQTVLGVLDVTMSLKEVDKQIRKSEVNILFFAIIAIAAIAIIIGIFVRRWVDKPVRELLTATKQVAGGNLNYTIREKGNDELGALAKSFNKMTQKLSEARMQVFQSDKMASLGRLAAGVAHEINNPLTGVLTYSSFLLKRAKDNPELHADLKVIVRETKRSREIVKSLLDFARQSVPKKKAANINEIIVHVASMMDNQLSLNKIELVKHLEENLPLLKVDANQMAQVFINLLVNAADAIGSTGGQITISTAALHLSPHGIMHIKKALCPKGHNLMDKEVKIEGLSSIKLKTAANGNNGLLHLDPVYGRHLHQRNVNFKSEESVHISCPQCNRSLIEKDQRCPKCHWPVFAFETSRQGKFEGCANPGCDWQKWDAAEIGGKKAYVEITFSDSGCGIPKADLDKIFEPFYSTKGQKGTGLGLAVTWGIIDNHDGVIRVDSEVGKGTTFTIRLPVGEE